MIVVVTENCAVAPEGHTTIQLKKDDQVTDEKLCKMLIANNLGKELKEKTPIEPQTKKPAKPKTTK